MNWVVLRRRNCVFTYGDGFVCVRCVGVRVVELSYEPPYFGGIIFVYDCTKRLFTYCLLFVSDIIMFVFFYCLY